MKKKIKLIKYGMSIHPGNGMYIVLCLGMLGLCMKECTLWYAGLIIGALFICLIILPLYIVTSYDVGRANSKDDEE